eukprot:scaffold5246_cov105-Isochrysis_galbana.AAC.5
MDQEEMSGTPAGKPWTSGIVSPGRTRFRIGVCTLSAPASAAASRLPPAAVMPGLTELAAAAAAAATAAATCSADPALSGSRRASITCGASLNMEPLLTSSPA